MTNVARFPHAPATPSEPHETLSEERVAAIKSLVKTTLSRDEQEQLIRELSEMVGTGQVRRGAVVGAIAQILHLRDHWTVREIKERIIEEQRIPASGKEIHNAVGYLTRIGRLQRVGYGKYLVAGGGLLTTAEDLGGEPDRLEDLSDDVPRDQAYRQFQGPEE
jgi:hypothetical protein